MLLIAALVVLLLVPSPWNVLAFAGLLAAGAIEVAYWRRRVKDRKLEAGAETLIGSRAKVVSACRPGGQVWVQGALWNARCAAGADADQMVTVVARDGLLLIVEPDGTGS
jgi:membrane protein implicated in regulation of membrane protease activity